MGTEWSENSLATKPRERERESATVLVASQVPEVLGCHN